MVGLGISEKELDDMKYKTFTDVISALGRKYNFDSISNLYGNSFAKDSGDIINGCNPLRKPPIENSLGKTFANMLSKIDENIVNNKSSDKALADDFDAMLADFAKQK